MLSSDSTSFRLRAQQNEFNLFQFLGILLLRIPNSPFLHQPVSTPSPALSHPGADRTHRAPGCPPAVQTAGQGAGCPEPRPQRTRRNWGQLSSVQPQLGSGASRINGRRPGVPVQVCLSVYSGPGGLRCACLPPNPGRNRASGIYVFFLGNPFYKHHRTRRTA